MCYIPTTKPELSLLGQVSGTLWFGRQRVQKYLQLPRVPLRKRCSTRARVPLPRPLNDIVFFSIAAEEGIEGTLIRSLKGGLMAALMGVGQSDDQQLDYHNIDCLIPNAELDSY